MQNIVKKGTHSYLQQCKKVSITAALKKQQLRFDLE